MARQDLLVVDADLQRRQPDDLAHEYAHSWDGKYRRPRGLATQNYQEPMRGDLPLSAT